jgi:predicted RNase H-like HicB family nuclease
MRRFLVIVEKAGKNYSAYSPDLPGCVATGDTPEETLENMKCAIEMHLEGLEEDRASVSSTSAVRADFLDFAFAN